jgi:hypothetical protein
MGWVTVHFVADFLSNNGVGFMFVKCERYKLYTERFNDQNKS